MKTKRSYIGLALLLGLVVAGNGCILEEVVAELVLTSETCAVFEQREDSANWNNPFILSDYADDLDDALAEGGWSRSDIISASLMAAHYGVTQLISNPHDWEVSGAISVQVQGGGGGAAILIDYTSVSVQGALGQKIVASLNAAGVQVINDALTAYIGGANPVLVFNDVGSGVNPVPTPSDMMEFDWKAWLTIQVILETVTDVPDPF